MLRRVLARAGFEVRATDDPDVLDSPLNFLAVRLGRDVPAPAAARMAARLFLGGSAARRIVGRF